MTEHLQGDGLTKREMQRQHKMYKKQMNQRNQMLGKAVMWGIGILVVGIIFAGLVKLLAPAFTVTPLPDDFSVNTITANDHVKGNPNAKVVLVEYLDFQCPACGSYFSLVKRLNVELGDQVAIVVRNFPLRQIHPHADPMAQAAEAAGKQGKYFEMHDLIFQNQAEWSRLPRVKSVIEDYAEQLALNMEQFKADMENAEIKDKINFDLQGGRASGVTGTPTFFLNGKQITNPRSYDEFKTLIEQALNA